MIIDSPVQIKDEFISAFAPGEVVIITGPGSHYAQQAALIVDYESPHVAVILTGPRTGKTLNSKHHWAHKAPSDITFKFRDLFQGIPMRSTDLPEGQLAIILDPGYPQTGDLVVKRRNWLEVVQVSYGGSPGLKLKDTYDVFPVTAYDGDTILRSDQDLPDAEYRILGAACNKRPDIQGCAGEVMPREVLKTLCRTYYVTPVLEVDNG